MDADGVNYYVHYIDGELTLSVTHTIHDTHCLQPTGGSSLKHRTPQAFSMAVKLSEQMQWTRGLTSG